jgi:trimethyllysine dioxygenase
MFRSSVVLRSGAALFGRSAAAPPLARGAAAAASAEDVACWIGNRSNTIASFRQAPCGRALELTWADGHVSLFHYVWLRDHCPTIFDAATRQRAVHHPHIPLDIVPTRVSTDAQRTDAVDAAALGSSCSNSSGGGGSALPQEDGAVLTLEWPPAAASGAAGAGGQLNPVSRFQATWLRRACYSDARRDTRESAREASRTSWAGGGASHAGGWEPPRCSFGDAMGSSQGLWAALSPLWRYGLLIVEGVPEQYSGSSTSTAYLDATEAFAKRVGFVRRTLYGDMWEFGTYAGTDAGNDSAYSDIALELHTDGAYMADPPALQLWTCMYAAADGGGVSRYVDGLRVAERLQEVDPAAYAFFRSTPLSYHCQDDGTSLVSSGPVFEHDQPTDARASAMDRFRYNDYDRLTLSHLPPDQVEAFYTHHRALSAILADPAMEYQLALEPGTMAVVHNQRVMHGRSAFTGRRGLCGCYIGDDEFRSKLRRLAQELGDDRQSSSSSVADGDRDDDGVWNLLLGEGLDVGIAPPARLRY